MKNLLLLCFLSLSAAFLAACSTTSEAPSSAPLKSPDLQLGELIQILPVKTVRDRVRVISAKDGSLHVFIAATELGNLLEVYIPSDGAPYVSRVVLPDAAPENMDAAFDAQEKLHAIADTEHLVLDNEGWQKSSRTPWQGIKVNVEAAHFVQGAKDLTWMLQVNGKDLQVPLRMEMYGAAGYGGGIIWPWFTHGVRTVFVAQTPDGYGPWFVIEPQQREDTTVYSIAADRKGNLHLVYKKSHSGFPQQSSHSYMQIDADVLLGKASLESYSEVQSTSSFKLYAVKGQDVGKETTAEKYWQGDSTPFAFPGGQYDYRLRYSAYCEDTWHVLTAGEPKDSWWGKGNPIRYQRYSNNEWSAPVEVGVADVSSFWGYFVDALDITCIDNDRAFLVWPTEQGFVGRWVKNIPEKQKHNETGP